MQPFSSIPASPQRPRGGSEYGLDLLFVQDERKDGNVPIPTDLCQNSRRGGLRHAGKRHEMDDPIVSFLGSQDGLADGDIAFCADIVTEVSL